MLLDKLYMCSGSVVAFTYLFQVWKVFKDKTNSDSISILSWGAWCISSLITLSYISIHTHDSKLILFAFIDHVCCLLVTFFAIRNRRRK